MRISDWSSDVCSSDPERAILIISREGTVAGPLLDRTSAGVEARRGRILIAAQRIDLTVHQRRVAIGLVARRRFGGRLLCRILARRQLGRASCRERVGQYV